MENKWAYILQKEHKQVLTNRKSCPVCGEYRRIKKLVSFVVLPGFGMVRPYVCGKCGCNINVALHGLMDHVNKNGRPYPIDLAIRPDIPLFKDWRKEQDDQSSEGETTQ